MAIPLAPTVFFWLLVAPPGGAPAAPGTLIEQPAADSNGDAPPPSEWDRKQAEAEATEPSETEERSFIGQVAQTLIALLVICGVLWLVGKFAIARLSNVRYGGGSGQTIKICERLQLDPRTSVYLVEVGDYRLLLGTGEKGVHLISRLAPTPESVATEPVPKSSSSFHDAMERVVSPVRPESVRPVKDDDDS